MEKQSNARIKSLDLSLCVIIGPLAYQGTKSSRLKLEYLVRSTSYYPSTGSHLVITVPIIWAQILLVHIVLFSIERY